MRIAYVTLDDVNRFIVRRWADKDTFRAEFPAVNVLAASVDVADAVILDLDHLPEPFRTAWLTGVSAGRLLVHGHNITDAEAAMLRRRGVRVCRGRLHRGLVCVLAGEVASSEESASRECRQPEFPETPVV